jgi:beta-glucosidase
MKKSKTKGVIGSILIVLLVVAIIVMDVMCYTYSNMITLFFNQDRTTSETADLDAVEEAAQDLTAEVNAEGSVLLKNDGDLLPISGKVNLFGACSYQELYLGTGSAGGWNWDSESCVNLKDALEAQGIEVNSDLWEFYVENYTENAGQSGGVTNMTGASHNIVEQPLENYGDSLLESSKEYSDTAILVFGRAGGEGSDAIMDMADADGGDAGKSYLELQDVELELVEYVKANYANVIVLLNTPMPIECGWIDSEEDTGVDTVGDVDAVLWIGLPGLTGNIGVAEVLSGAVSPSGRLSDTWAYEVESAPSYYNFGDFTYTNGGDSAYTSKYVHYLEGIYVGYRWYETANAEGFSISGVTNYNGESKDFDFSDYDSVVQYPFGYGLSYTTFTQEWAETPTYDESTDTLTFQVKVNNTGSVASKTVVELYCQQPYTVGGIEKSQVVLVAYTKTSEIPAGGSGTVTLTVDKDQLASYDYQGEGCYVLDAGDYIFYSDLGENGSHCWAATDGVLSFTQSFSREVYDESNPRSTDQVAAVNQFDDVTAGDGTYSTDDYLTRADFASTFPKAFADATATASDEVMAIMTNSQMGAMIPDDDSSVAMPTTGDTSVEIYCADMAGLAYDDPKWDDLLNRMSVDELVTLTAACGWQNPSIASIKKKACIDMDGAEGLHDLVNDESLNMYNSSVVMASAWNTELAYKMGVVYGEECLSQNVTGVYGFSMDTHRSPFGGRCFEYYSEDGVLSGYTAAAQTSGLQSQGITVYSKHFAVNDQETNRGGVHVWLNEQALREVYLRPFEICVETSTFEYSDVMNGASGIMTSYNAIGTSWSSACYPLLTTVLRNEWGFTGRVVTDAVGTDGYDLGDTAVRAGTDMFLCPMGSVGRYTEDTTSTAAGVAALREAAKHQLFVYANSACLGKSVTYNTAWIAIPVAVSVVLAIACVVLFWKMVKPSFFSKAPKVSQ